MFRLGIRVIGALKCVRMNPRTILHVDMDAFYAAVEQRDHPEWRGRPVIVGAPPDRRGVVSAASYEARRFGVHSAMPSRTAGRLCPSGVFCPVDMPRYAAESRRIFSIFERFTPLIEPLSLDEAFLDVTGARSLFGGGPEIARRIRAAIAAETGLTASVGVAPNKFLAKLASDLRKPDALTVVPTEPAAIAAFLRPLPVSRIFGVGRTTQAQLARLGVRLIGDLQDLAPETLARRLGRRAAQDVLALAFGRDERAVEPDADRKSIGREYTFDDDCESPAEVRKMLLALGEDVGGQLRADHLTASGVRLKLRWKDFTTITRQQSLSRPFSDDITLRRAALQLLANVPMAAPVRLVGVAVFGLAGAAGAQLTLPLDDEKASARWEKLSRSVDAVRRRYGAASLVSGVSLEPPPSKPPAGA